MTPSVSFLARIPLEKFRFSSELLKVLNVFAVPLPLTSFTAITHRLDVGCVFWTPLTVNSLHSGGRLSGVPTTEVLK